MPGLRQVGAPSTVTVPFEGDRKPAIMCSTVVLPAPFGPSRPVTPGCRAMLMSLTATTLPYQRETFCNSTTLIELPFVRAAGLRKALSSHSQGGHLPVPGQQQQQAGGDHAERLDPGDRAEVAAVQPQVGAVAQPDLHAVDQRDRAGQPGQVVR